MKLNCFLIIFFLAGPTLSYAAEFGNPQERMAKVQDLAAAAQDIPLGRGKLLGLCRGLDGARWCEGYIAAILTVYQIPRGCLPRTDMAPFMNGQVWELTTAWLMRQPEGSSFSFFDAVTGALAEEDRCPMGAMIEFDGPELIPFSELEINEMSRLRDLLPLEEVVPTYSPFAVQNGIEGWCQVSFTVTEDGGVRDIELVDADPPDIFDAVCVQAAEQLRYAPHQRNGVGVTTPNVQHVFRFNLEQR